MTAALTKPEYKNLCKKANKGYFPVDYFRKNFFNSSFRDSFILKRKKVVYDDGDTVVKINRSLNQKHRDLLSIVMYEKNTQPDKNGSYKIQTKLYDLAKKMGYKKPLDARHIVKQLLDDLRHTDITTKKGNLIHQHMFLGYSLYNEDTDMFEIEVPFQTAKYAIFTTGVLIPQDINTKIVKIPNNKSKLKALIGFLLSNKKLKNGIGLQSVCDKLDILKSDMKSKFKKQVKENIDLLKEFKISYIDEKFFLDEQIVEFERAINDKDIEKAKFKEFIEATTKLYNGEKLCVQSINEELRELYIIDYSLHIKDDDKIIPLTHNKRVISSIFRNLYLKKVELAPLDFGTPTLF